MEAKSAESPPQSSKASGVVVWTSSQVLKKQHTWRFPGSTPTRLLALASVLIAMVLLPAAEVSANGPHVRSQEVFSGAAGPYDLRVVTAPLVGNMHLTIYIAQMGVGNPVSDAKVRVSGQGPQGAPQTSGPMLATGSLSGPNWYGVNLPIEEAGEWVFTLTVESSLGEATVDFPVNVRESGVINWGIIGVVVVVVGVAVWLTLSRRRESQAVGIPPGD